MFPVKSPNELPEGTAATTVPARLPPAAAKTEFNDVEAL